MTQDLCSMLLRALSVCSDLIYLDLSDNDVGDAALELADAIRSWGKNPPLRQLYLARCSMPDKGMAEILKALSGCKKLQTLNIENATFGESGHILASTIRSWGDNPSLEVLNLAKSTISLDSRTELLKSLSSCKGLKSLLLGKTHLQRTGMHMARSIKSWGADAPLEELGLEGCFLDEDDCTKLLQALANCKSLVHLDLSGNTLGEAGHDLAKCFFIWGDNVSLQTLQMSNCAMSVEVWCDLMKHFSTTKNLTHLDLSENNLDEAERHLASSIECWGDCPQLSVLNLEKCAMPENVWAVLFDALSTCRNIKSMNLSQNVMGAAGQNFARYIKSWGPNPPLTTLYLNSCGMSVDNWNIVLQSLFTCKNLSGLILSNNSLNEAAAHLVELFRSFGEDNCLRVLFLRKCSLPPDICTNLLRILAAFSKLTVLDLSFSNLKISGHQLAHAIRCWGTNPDLQILYLRSCSLTEEACSEIITSLTNCKGLTSLDLTGSHLGKAALQLKCYLETITEVLEALCLDRCSIPNEVSGQMVSVLSSCKNLRHFSLPGNTLTGVFCNFVPHACLSHVDLSDSTLGKADLKHLAELIEQKKVSNLSELWLIGNSLNKLELELEQLLGACVTCHQRELTVFLFRNNLSSEFTEKWTAKCKETMVKLDFERDVDP